MKKTRMKAVYIAIGLCALIVSIAWTYKSFRSSTATFSYLVDALIIILLLALLFNRNGKVKKSLDHSNYMEWITDGNVENCSKLSVGIKSLEDLVKLAIDLDKRVIHDSKLGKYFVLADDMTYIHDPGLSNPITDHKQQLGRMLIERGLIQPEQLETGLYYQKRIGCKLGESLMALGFIDESIVYSTLAAQYKMPYYELDTKKEFTDNSWLAKMSLNKARALQAIPLGYRVDGKLVIACGEIAKVGVTAALQEAFGTEIYIVVARPSHIYEILERFDNREKKSGYSELVRERRIEAYERLSEKEWEQFISSYNAGKIDTYLFIKATGLVDPIQLLQTLNKDIIISWLTGKCLINGQITNLIKTFERLNSKQDKELRQAKVLPELMDILEEAHYITKEELNWVYDIAKQEGLPVEKVLESNYMASVETLEYTKLILETIKSILNKAKIY